MGVVEDVRFIDSCNRCGMQLREYYRNTGSIKYPEGKWVSEVHEIPDCIRYLAEKIGALENKKGRADNGEVKG